MTSIPQIVHTRIPWGRTHWGFHSAVEYKFHSVAKGTLTRISPLYQVSLIGRGARNLIFTQVDGLMADAPHQVKANIIIKKESW